MTEKRDELLSKIKAIALVNKEISARINAKKKIQSYVYNLDIAQFSSQGSTLATDLVTVAETAKTTEVASIIGEWKPNLQLKHVRDVFNDKIVYTCNNLEDVIKLNLHMEEVAEKFELLDPLKAISYLEEFKVNLEIVQVALGTLEEMVVEPVSKKQEFEEHVQHINKLLKELSVLVKETNGKVSIEVPVIVKDNPTLKDNPTFGFGNFTKQYSGYRLLKFEELTTLYDSLREFYNKNNGLTNLEPGWNSGNCCFKVHGCSESQVVTIDGAIIFPAELNGSENCNKGYDSDKFKFITNPSKKFLPELPQHTPKWTIKADCSHSNNPAIFILQ